MVQRFNPVVKTTYHDYEEFPDRDAVMEHSRTGMWVKYETYIDSIAMLNAIIKRQERVVKNLTTQYNKD